MKNVNTILFLKLFLTKLVYRKFLIVDKYVCVLNLNFFYLVLSGTETFVVFPG